MKNLNDKATPPPFNASTLDEEKDAVWALSLSEALSNRHIDIYQKCFGSYQQVLSMSPQKIKSIGLIKNRIDFEGRNILLKKLAKVKQQCKSLNIDIVSIVDPHYPIGLKNTYLPPLVLYYRGQLAKYYPEKKGSYLAIVGTRRSDGFAEKITYDIAREFTTLGGHIISGLALGIDTQAHRGACVGPNTAVLGCGIDQIYPYGNRKLYQKILEQGGAIVSEFAPGVSPLPYHFPARNRIISGLAEAVLVTQAPHKSGALITIEFALDQGRTVFAYDFKEDLQVIKLDNHIINERNAGNYQLIKDGAIPITNINDLFDHQFRFLRKKYQKQVSTTTVKSKQHKHSTLNHNLHDICKILSESPKTLTELSHILHKDTCELSTLIMDGIINDIIKELPGKKYYHIP